MKGNAEQDTINVLPMKEYTLSQNLCLENMDKGIEYLRKARGCFIIAQQKAGDLPNADKVERMIGQLMLHEDAAKAYIRDKIKPEVKRG